MKDKESEKGVKTIIEYAKESYLTENLTILAVVGEHKQQFSKKREFERKLCSNLALPHLMYVGYGECHCRPIEVGATAISTIYQIDTKMQKLRWQFNGSHSFIGPGNDLHTIQINTFVSKANADSTVFTSSMEFDEPKQKHEDFICSNSETTKWCVLSSVQIVPEDDNKTGGGLAFTDMSIAQCVMKNVQKYYGDVGVAAIRSGLKCKYCNDQTRIAIIRIKHRPHRFVTSILPLIVVVGDHLAKFRILYNGATIMHCNKFIVNYQKQYLDRKMSSISVGQQKELLKKVMNIKGVEK